MNRREFLKLLILLGGTVAVSRCDSLEKGDGPIIEVNGGEGPIFENGGGDRPMIVVGAGIAGLSAAQALHKQGSKVIVLEARSRVGGRVHTSREWPDVPLALGASWIHGAKGNPISRLAKDNEIITVETDYDNTWVYNTDGSDLAEGEYDILEKYSTLFWRYLRKASNELDEDVPIQTVINTLLTKENFSKAEKQTILYLLNRFIEHEYAADINELSAFAFDGGDAFRGEDVVFPDGYDQVVNILAKGLDIRINEVVQHVEYGEAGMTVTTEQARFEGERAIITLPLGVLRAGSVQFSPALPTQKRYAIQALRMGLLGKVYLRFPHIFWPKEPEFIGYISATKGHWSEWMNIAYYTDAPILLGFNAASFARETETWGDQQIVASAMETLRTMFGTNIPKPDSWQITRWASDPYALGAYSYLPPGTSGETLKALAAPVASRLYFAGEATSSDYQATVHGAYLSGIRAARELIAEQSVDRF